VNAVDGVDCDWTVVCVEQEQQRRRWAHFDDEMTRCDIPACAFCVDAVCVLEVC